MPRKSVVRIIDHPMISAITVEVKQDKNSAEVDIAPALGEITTACNVGQANWVMNECMHEEYIKD